MPDISLNPSIGSPLELDSMANDDLTGLQAELKGLEQNKHLIITHPILSEREVLISKGDKFFVCLSQDGSDITFESEVLEQMDTPAGQMVRISYPESIRAGSIRKSNRIAPAPVEVRISGRSDSEDTTVSMLNISCSGACLVSDQILGSINDQFQLEMNTGSAELVVTLDCMIRHVQTVTEKNHTRYHHGVVFFGMDAEQQLFIWKFFQESSAYLEKG